MKNGTSLQSRQPKRTGERTHSERGWLDYLAGLNFPQEYDTWEDYQQRNYEYGRMRAAAAKFYYSRVPPTQTTAVVHRVAIIRDGYAPPRD